jgi:hypothetical protein
MSTHDLVMNILSPGEDDFDAYFDDGSDEA